ncbi:MAG: single-strand binding family protein [Pseudonocardiales bacterium]|nr:single-strand binding family protein [Pseudonocardiales bacterium]
MRAIGPISCRPDRLLFAVSSSERQLGGHCAQLGGLSTYVSSEGFPGRPAVRLAGMTTTATKQSKQPAQNQESGDAHRNEVVLVGELAAPPQARSMPSGDEVVSFRLTVRSSASVTNSSRAATSASGAAVIAIDRSADGASSASKPARSRSGGKAAASASRSDSIDCAVWRSDLRARVQKYRVGDVLEVTGAVRHRYWRGASGLASRYEVEVEKIRIVTKARVAKTLVQAVAPDALPPEPGALPSDPVVS